MNKAQMLYMLDELRTGIIDLDVVHRQTRGRFSHAEFADMLKAIRTLKLSMEIGAFDYCFKKDQDEECEGC